MGPTSPSVDVQECVRLQIPVPAVGLVRTRSVDRAGNRAMDPVLNPVFWGGVCSSLWLTMRPHGWAPAPEGTRLQRRSRTELPGDGGIVSVSAATEDTVT